MEQNVDASAPMAPATESSKQKGGNGLKIAVTIACIAAICGIGFGAYGMVRSFQKDNQISDLKAQIEDSDGKVVAFEVDENKVSDDSQTVTTDNSATKKKNPVISATAPKHYSTGLDSPKFSIDNKDYYVKLIIEDGDISSCDLYLDAVEWVKACSGIDGISGKIYKTVIAGEGQDASTSNVAFIMEDGTVSYLPTENLVKEIKNDGAASIKGTLKIDGFVVDAFTVGVREDGIVGGYVTTIFVLSDGTYVKYNTSMLN